MAITTGSGVTVTVDAKDNTATGFGAAAKGLKTVGEAADYTQAQLTEMDAKLAEASIRAARFADAEEKSAAKARDFAAQLAAARHELAQNGDESGKLATKIDRLAAQTRSAALATEEYRLRANRAAAVAREQARAYDEVGDQARQAAEAVALLGAAAHLGTPGGNGGRGVLGLAGKGFAGVGEGFGNLLGVGTSAAEGGLGTPVVGPALLAAGAAAAIPTASFIGAGIGGAGLAGLGLGGAGLGLAGAVAGNPGKFQAEWSHSIDAVKKRWIDSSAAFGDELEYSLKIADQTLRNLPVEKVLALSQSFVKPIVTGAGQGVSAAANGAADALEKVQVVVDKIGPKLGNLGADVGDAFRMIAQGSKGGADALGDLIDATGYAVKAVGLLILGFEDSYEKIRNFVTGVNDAAHQVPLLGTAMDKTRDALFGVHETAIVAARALDDNTAAGHGMAESWGDMAKAGAEAAIEAIHLNDALTKTRNTMLGMADANLAVQQGWIDLNEELRKGAKTLDTNTQEGVNNQKALLSQIELLEKKRETEIEAANGSKDAIDAANKSYADNIKRLRDAAVAAGFDATKVDQLLTSLGALPESTTTEVKVPGLATALGQGISLGNALNNIDGRTYYAKVDVSYQGYNPGVSLGNLTHHRAGGISRAATGGARGRDVMVGEDGPEIVRLPSGSMVYPKANASLMRAGGGGGVLQVELVVRGEGGRSSAMAEWLMRAQRTGEVQILASAVTG